MNSHKHIIQLDGLRFFAVLMVMIGHWLQWKWTNPILLKIPFVHGVILFFVLSGFLITRILLSNRDKYNESQKNKFLLIKNFYFRRFFRIFPIYYLLIFFLFIINFENTRELFPWLISYSSNIYQSINNVNIGNFNHFWSLAVEEQFYLFWPFIILFIKPNKTLLTIIIAILLALIVRTYLFFYVGKWMATSFFTLSSMHALGIGALLAYVKLYKPKVGKKLANPRWLYLVSVLYVLALIIQNKFNLAWQKAILDHFFFSILSFFIILRASENNFKGLAKKVL
jgi:peptidoglycan/LPS O-acetylase OafA/YrhL